MTGIEFYTNGHIISDADSMRQKLGALAKQYSATSAIIVTDAGISQLGYVDIAQQSLQEAGVEVVVLIPSLLIHLLRSLTTPLHWPEAITATWLLVWAVAALLIRQNRRSISQ